jgi:galacturonokinase
MPEDTAALVMTNPRAESSWPSESDLANLRADVSAFARSHGVPVDPKDVRVAVAPYRVCPLGAHVDHQGGCVAGMALDCGVLFGFVPSPNSDSVGADRNESVGPTKVLLRSDAFAGDVRFDVRDPFGTVTDEGDTTDRNWGALARGAAAVLNDECENDKNEKRKRKLALGCIGVARSFPIGVRMDGGGVSSSAAITVGLLLAMRSVNGLGGSNEESMNEESNEPPSAASRKRTDESDSTKWRVARSARRVENDFLHVKCGILDQATICLSRQSALVVVDCALETHEHVLFGGRGTANASQEGTGCKARSTETVDETVPAFKILLAFSGLRQALTSTGYNGRVEECHEAAAFLLRNSTGGSTLRGMTWDSTTGDTATLRSTGDTSGDNPGDTPATSKLSDVPYETYVVNRDALPLSLRRRADHFFGEARRVSAGKTAWRAGDLDAFGALMTESGTSSITNYECGCVPMNALLTIVCATTGVYGARFSGAGFRGCVVGLVETSGADAAASAIAGEYKRVHPELAGDAKVLVANSGHGARVLW